MKINNRMYKMQDYQFKTICDFRRELMDSGKEVIDLSIGDPDLLVHENILNILKQNVYKEGFNKYPPYDGILALKKQVIKYYKETYNVDLNLNEVIILIGSKEGISKIIPAVCDIGDYMIIPDPAYPVYLNNAYLWGVQPEIVPLKESNGYLPDMNNLSRQVISKSKLFIINYPNNPTGAMANKEFYRELIQMCYDYGIVLCNDNAYGDIIEDKSQAISLLQYDKEKQCVEFGTMSKSYNMTGFRLGYVVGNSKVLKELLKVKSTMDSGQYIPIQLAGIEALKLGEDYLESIREVYSKRRSIAKELLEENDIEYFDSKGTFYIWCKTPKKYTTYEFCKELAYRCNLIVTPGCTFGNLGYDYFRISLTANEEKIRKGLKNLKIIK